MCPEWRLQPRTVDQRGCWPNVRRGHLLPGHGEPAADELLWHLRIAAVGNFVEQVVLADGCAQSAVLCKHAQQKDSGRCAHMRQAEVGGPVRCMCAFAKPNIPTAVMVRPKPPSNQWQSSGAVHSSCRSHTCCDTGGSRRAAILRWTAATCARIIYAGVIRWLGPWHASAW